MIADIAEPSIDTIVVTDPGRPVPLAGDADPATVTMPPPGEEASAAASAEASAPDADSAAIDLSPVIATLLGDAAARDRVIEALGRPTDAAGYAIEGRHPLLEPDLAVNSRLHAAGFTQEQAQLAYDLAAELLVPAIENVVAEARAERMIEELAGGCGGREAWSRMAGQLRTWGAAHLDQETYEALSSTVQGVRAMQALMRSQEPALAGGGAATGPIDQAELDTMLADPRYWRDRDPDLIARVTAGFTRLYAR